MLRIDPAQRHRLEEIRDNLLARIAEAEREGWTGEAEGLRISLDAANNKLAQADLTTARRAEAVNLGIPAYRDIAAATLTPDDRADKKTASWFYRSQLGAPAKRRYGQYDAPQVCHPTAIGEFSFGCSSRQRRGD
jgi:hypothetical protein